MPCVSAVFTEQPWKKRSQTVFRKCCLSLNSQAILLVFTPKGLYATAQGREALRAHPGNRRTPPRVYPEGVVQQAVTSIPHIPLVELDPVELEKPPKLVLKRLFLVMLFLVGDICFQHLHMAGAN